MHPQPPPHKTTPHTAPSCPTLALPPQANELAWERWVYTFAQARQLAVLAPRLPTSDPRLKPSTYDMVLASLLLRPSGERGPAACGPPARWPAPL